MDLLKQNINLQPKKAQMLYGMVDWMQFTEQESNPQSPQEYFEQICLLDRDGENFGLLKDQDIDIIIGSDLIW